MYQSTRRHAAWELTLPDAGRHDRGGNQADLTVAVCPTSLGAHWHLQSTTRAYALVQGLSASFGKQQSWAEALVARGDRRLPEVSGWGSLDRICHSSEASMAASACYARLSAATAEKI